MPRAHSAGGWAQARGGSGARITRGLRISVTNSAETACEPHGRSHGGGCKRALLAGRGGCKSCKEGARARRRRGAWGECT